MGKLGVGLEALLEALVVVSLGALADVGDGREGRYGEEVTAVETWFIGALLAPCVYIHCMLTAKMLAINKYQLMQR